MTQIDPDRPTTISTDKARQGRKGWQVLLVLTSALALTILVWVGVGFYGEAIDKPEPATDQQ